MYIYLPYKCFPYFATYWLSSSIFPFSGDACLISNDDSADTINPIPDSFPTQSTIESDIESSSNYVQGVAIQPDEEAFEDDQESEGDIAFDIGDDEDYESDNDELRSLADDLLLFYVGSNVSVVWMKLLLKILKGRVDGVPSFHSLRKRRCGEQKPKEFKIDNGEVCLFSIFDLLKELTDKMILKATNGVVKFKLKVNIDSLSIYKSSSLSLTPILLRFTDINLPRIFPIGFFLGRGKPNVSLFLGDFIEELVQLAEGKLIDNVSYCLSDILFLCDAPARAYLQGVNYHGHKEGCSYCSVQGKYMGGRMTYSSKSHQLRSDSNYRNGLESNQVSVSPLLKLSNLGLRSSFPPEYQHLVCLGVCRRLLSFYFTKVKDFKLPCRLSQTQLNYVSMNITRINGFIPGEFQRRLRNLKEFNYFKATEFRSLLLYFGPYLLRKCLKKEYLDHFQLLHFSTYVFCSNNLSHLSHNAACALKLFIKRTKQLFTRQCMTYNFHVLVHLPEFYDLYGPLDKWSTFLPESFLSTIKRRIKQTPHIFHHVRNVISVVSSQEMSVNSKFQFTKDVPNNVCMFNTSVLMITTVHDDGKVSGRLMSFEKNLYEYPYPSGELHIGFYRASDDLIEYVEPTNKCICVPHKQLYLIWPFASTIYSD